MRTRFIVLVVVHSVMAFAQAARPTISLTAASAELKGVTLDTRATTQPVGGSGVAFLTGFTNGKERAVFNFDSPGGLYAARLHYRAGGNKAYILDVNGLAYGATIPKTGRDFAASSPLHVLLTAGRNTVAVGGGWGQYDIARIDLEPIDAPTPPKPPTTGPSDPQVTPSARALWNTLATNYGKTTLSGVYAKSDLAYVHDTTGKTPAILGADLMDYSPSRVAHGANPKDIDQQLIRQAREGLILTLSWHWNAPAGLVDNAGQTESLTPHKRWYMGFYKEASTFDYAAALADETGPDYQLLLRDIDAIAAPLKALQAADVPVLWRPLHEAEGGWFWWGTKGPQNYVKLWRLVHDRLTRHHGLHNLLWVFTAAQDAAWYPGDDVVDIVGIDNYPKDNRDPLVSDWQTVLTQFGDRKLIALSEVGFLPDLDLAARHGVYWSYFNTWNGEHGPKNLPPGELKRRFDSERMASK